MVMAMVNVPHGLPFSALTTTRPTTASRMTMMRRTVTSEMKPPTLPISSRAIWPERFAVAAHGAEEDGEILHGARQDRSEEIQRTPGR